MCGRYALDADIDQLIERYKAIIMESQFAKKKEIFPTEKMPVVIGGENRVIKDAKWGFSPSFAKRPLINARGETVFEKATFKKPFLNNRCIIPATWFYEWEEVGGMKVKRKISLKNREIFSMAGLLDDYYDKDGNVYTAFTIITTDANYEMKIIHDRMPVILSEGEEEIWLNKEEKSISKLLGLLDPLSEQLIIE